MRRAKRIWLLPLAFAVLCGCGGGKAQEDGQDAAQAMRAQAAYQAEEPVIGLILTSQDAEENEELISRFQEAAEDAGARLLIRIPEVSKEDAEEAAALVGSFVLCDVDPVEFQMLYVDELVAEGVDVIAIWANHGEALKPVLSAARAVGIRVCAFERQVGEGSCDLYVGREGAAAAAAGLLEKEE